MDISLHLSFFCRALLFILQGIQVYVQSCSKACSELLTRLHSLSLMLQEYDISYDTGLFYGDSVGARRSAIAKRKISWASRRRCTMTLCGGIWNTFLRRHFLQVPAQNFRISAREYVMRFARPKLRSRKASASFEGTCNSGTWALAR